MNERDPNLIQLPQWGTAADAAAAHGIAPRTLRLWAKQGKVKRRGSGRATRYQLPATDTAAAVSGNDAGMPLAAVPPMPATMPPMPATMPPQKQPDTDTIAVLREELAASRAETVAAERRAAVAEYRAQLSETDPAEVEALRERVATLAQAVEEAEGQARDLAARLRKRFALIQRLTAEIGRARSGSAD